MTPRVSRHEACFVGVVSKAEMPAVREEWRQYVKSLTGVVSRHSKEIDQYIQIHGPMTRPEVIERALTKLLSEV